MSLCRIVGLDRSIRYKAKSSAGVWRTLSDGDTLDTGDTLDILAGGAKFGSTVCILQAKVSSVWTDSITITLDLTTGSSHKRQDRLTITGDATDSDVSVDFTTNKGHAHLLHAYRNQIDAEANRGIVFEWSGQLWDGVISEIEKGRDHGKGGFLEESDARLVANRPQFVAAGKAPFSGNTISADGEAFEIVDPVGVGDWAYTFELKRCNRG